MADFTITTQDSLLGPDGDEPVGSPPLGPDLGGQRPPA